MQAKLAAEQSALLHKQQIALQSDLDAATQELERLQQEQSNSVSSSPTDSEQVYGNFAESKDSPLRRML